MAQQKKTSSQMLDPQFAEEIERTLNEIAANLLGLASRIRGLRDDQVEPPEVHVDVAIPPDDVIERLRGLAT